MTKPIYLNTHDRAVLRTIFDSGMKQADYRLRLNCDETETMCLTLGRREILDIRDKLLPELRSVATIEKNSA